MPDTKPLTIDAATTALVLIDLQNGVTGRQLAPRHADTVVENSVLLANRFREVGAVVVLVRVTFSADGRDRVARPVDSTFTMGTPPPGWDQIVPALGPHPSDIVVIKRNWGAFYGTDLDLHLRRRGVQTIALGGIATCYGVESTARDAFEHNYGLVLVEDAMSDMDAQAHEMTVSKIFPRLGLVRSTAQVLAALD